MQCLPPTLNWALRNGSDLIVSGLVQLPAGAGRGTDPAVVAKKVTVSLSLGAGDTPWSLIRK